ncbi:O-antigen/teichoic acid export membrane protein [Parabacteroides sp. PF5-5]|uniref:lipopolysaccharide biosynthesis protein n=1 Tax=unclassified Parabacteroides TaxID=2649774 RepID=UPI00247445EE|nr:MULTISPECIES: lipopolysaccharide biosynthesis protein [unclassified Parabacteroides]MDH6306786.1 O-antigen/teichoic acid export membrane protein [Parabacteroides sp. PH5-39]MDH6317672.1 O-antigen/teichoic acid export membrane protein [Parabacteroides sp. PF5-13]MDH6321498.1 O-antigen/teichoic acid export membrane protein [Parabacteroides sp. PH5-13]MDH6325225.1 O-antigen/teichoic acid export membrane protein [Parabacteroides sp. PH5-8]MDH6328857.1 O-antigen/teichoic acid export membrane pro
MESDNKPNIQNPHPPEPTLKEKTAKGLFWGGISKGIQQILSVFIGIILLNNLTPDDYGMIGLLAIFIGIANTIQESGFTSALANKSEFNSEDYNSVFWFCIIISIIIYTILFCCAPLIAIFFNEPNLKILARILFLSFVANSISISHNAVLFKKIMVKERAKVDIISTLTSGAIGIYLAINGYGYWALAFQTLTYTVMGSILRWYYSPWKPTFIFNFTPIKKMFGFSSKLMVSSIITQIQSNIFSVLLGKFQTKTDVGYFSQGFKWASMGAEVISGTVSGIAQPIFVLNRNNKKKQVQIFRKLLRFIAFISFPSLLGLAFVSREFITLINSDWLPCVPILQLYCIWAITAPISVLYMQLAISYNKSFFYFTQTILYALIQISIAFCVLPYGIYWMAFANVLTTYLYLLIWHIYISRLIPLKIISVLKDISPYLIISIILIVFTHYLVKDLEVVLFRFFLKILTVSVLYILIVWKSNSTIFKESVSFIFQKR